MNSFDYLCHFLWKINNGGNKKFLLTSYVISGALIIVYFHYMCANDYDQAFNQGRLIRRNDFS